MSNSSRCWSAGGGPSSASSTARLSLSSTSAAKIGERTADLAAELRTALAPFAVEGMISEVVESGATIAWRPAG